MAIVSRLLIFPLPSLSVGGIVLITIAALYPVDEYSLSFMKITVFPETFTFGKYTWGILLLPDKSL